MTVLFILFPLALLIAAVAVVAFIWSVRSGQLDDLDTPALRILHDDEPSRQTSEPDTSPAGGSEGETG